jgi:hypothetical protein
MTGLLNQKVSFSAVLASRQNTSRIQLILFAEEISLSWFTVPLLPGPLKVQRDTGFRGNGIRGSGSYLIPAFNQIQQEHPRKLSFFRQEHQMVTMDFNLDRSHVLLGIASQPDQKSLI